MLNVSRQAIMEIYTMMTPARKEPDLSTYAGRFAARLRELRDASGMSANDVAERLQVALRTYLSWEAGERQPPLNAYPVLAKSFKLKAIRQILPEE